MLVSSRQGADEQQRLELHPPSFSSVAELRRTNGSTPGRLTSIWPGPPPLTSINASHKTGGWVRSRDGSGRPTASLSLSFDLSSIMTPCIRYAGEERKVG